MALGKIPENMRQIVILAVHDHAETQLDHAGVTGNCFPIRIRIEHLAGGPGLVGVLVDAAKNSND